jgi:uncharacterized protein (DUF2141 family)
LVSGRSIPSLCIILANCRVDITIFIFLNIPPGTYALAVIHDENMNGKLDTNWLGIPKEGYGFSNAAKATLGAPSFSAASFRYDGQDMELTISLPC